MIRLPVIDFSCSFLSDAGNLRKSARPLILPAEAIKKLNKACHGTVSLPFGLGEHSRTVVDITDDRRTESLKAAGWGNLGRYCDVSKS